MDRAHLAIVHEHFGVGRHRDATLPDVLDDADDLQRHFDPLQRLVEAVSDPPNHRAADGIRLAKEPARDRAVDDRRVRTRDAIALIDRALGVVPDDGLLLARGFLLERIDRVPEAVTDMRKVAKRRPNDPMTLNALGYTLVDRTRSVAEGTELIERAIAAKPDSYAIQDSMGWALVQAGQLEQGKEWLDRAWVLSEDPEVAAHLGETLWRMGRPEDAKRLWDEALADNPDSPPLKRAIERRSP